MTKEEEQRRQTQESSRSEPMSTVVRSRQNSRPTPVNALGVDGPIVEQSEKSTPPGSPRAVEKTMKKAQKSTDKQTSSEKGRRESEEEKPRRTLLTAEAPNTLLPVVSEENISDRSRSTSQQEDVDDLETKLPPPATQQTPQGIRMVSASTKRASHEETRADEDHDEEEDEDEVRLDEKASEKRFSHPPRLNSDMLPKMTPIYSNEISFEPEKS